MVSSSIPGDTRIAPCAVASTSTYIRRTKSAASKDRASVATPAAKVARVDRGSKAPVEANQLVTRSFSKDTVMPDFFNKQRQSPPTTTTNITALVPLAKKKRNAKFKSGPSNSKAAQGRS